MQYASSFLSVCLENRLSSHRDLDQQHIHQPAELISNMMYKVPHLYSRGVYEKAQAVHIHETH